MTPQEFQKFYPLVIEWLRTTLMTHAGIARTVASCVFPRLPLYFTADTLALAFTTSNDAFDAEKMVAEKLRLWKRMRPAGR
jgi:hypothetical protein